MVHVFIITQKSGGNLSVNCQNKKGFAPLHISIIEKNKEAFQLFLKKGAKVNVQTNKHITPLHLACYHCNIDVSKLKNQILLRNKFSLSVNFIEV